MKDTDRGSGIAPPDSICPGCGTRFGCGMKAGEKRCWCADLPPLLTVPAGKEAGCYCPACLARMLAEAQSG